MPTATEPAFLSDRRRQAQELATTLNLPARTDEAWRRTSLEGLELDSFKVAAPAYTLVGQVPDGVIFMDILTAATEHPDLVSKYLGTLFSMGQNKLTAAQAAHLTGGVFLYVPAGVAVAEPLQVTYQAAEGTAQYLHTLVIAERNSSVTLLERFEGTGEYVQVGVVEVFPQENSRVRYGYLQNQSEDAWSFSFRRGRTGRDAGLDWVGGDFGGSLARSELYTDVNGEGSESTIKVVYGATARQHLDIVASQVHTGQNGFGDILGRGVVTGRAHTIFRGLGKIAGGARNCNTQQKQQALILSTKARADSIPALIIDENEVPGAGHASTIGKLDEEAMFYLMARGLSREQATHMLVMAFLVPVLEQIPVEELREEMTRLMGEKVTG